MKILLINNLATLHGGAEIMVDLLVRGLREQGHEVLVLCGDEPGNGKRIADRTFRTFRDGSAWRVLYACNPFAVRQLRKTLREFKPDIVHLHNVSKASPFILPLLRSFPTVLTLHDYLVFDPTRLKDLPSMAPYGETMGDYFTDRPSARFFLEKLRFGLFRRFASSIDLTLACSRFFRQCARESGMFPQVDLIPHGLVLPPYALSRTEGNILFVGRLDRIKGTHILLRAFGLLSARHPEAQLLIAGTGPEEERLKLLAQELGIERKVEFLGYRTPLELRLFYQAATIVAVPSLCPDNLPLVCLEAMGTGRPVVGSDIGGIPDLITAGETGLLVPPGDIQQLAVGLEQLLADREVRERMGEAGRKEAEEHFSDRAYLERTLEIYEKIRHKKQDQ